MREAGHALRAGRPVEAGQATDHHGAHPNHTNHAGHGSAGLRSMAASATLHCLTGCAIGEILGLIIGTAAGLGNGATIALSVALAFFFGYTLSSLPLLRSGLALGAALRLVLAADTVSILTMEAVDNLVMAVIPGAMNAGLVNAVFWVGMSISLVAAFFAAYPVNRYLLARGKRARPDPRAPRREPDRSPAPGASSPCCRPSALAAAIAAFVLGGFVVAVADGLASPAAPPAHPSPGHAATRAWADDHRARAAGRVGS